MHNLYALYVSTIGKNQWIAFYIPVHSGKIKSNRHPDVHISDIDYADDIDVIINSLIDANKLLNKFEDTAKDIGLHIKSDKTE